MRTVWMRCIKLWNAWRAARARDDLRALSDRTLQDIGLRRSQIDSLFR
jgi:uncharacterized protein YjiS (DUF1127 family)